MFRSTSTRTARLGVALALGLSMAVSGYSPARAGTSSAADGVQHFVTCLDLLLTNGQQHAQECGPSLVPSNDPLVPTSGGGPDCSFTPAMLHVLPGTLRTASLGDGSEFLGPQPSIGSPMLLAKPIDPCHHCPVGLLQTPLGTQVHVASLEDFEGLLARPLPTGSMVSTC